MQFDWWSLALQAVNFLVLVWLLRRFLFRPVQQLIRARKARSEDLLRAARKKLDEAEAEKARYDAQIAAFEAQREDSLREFQARLDADRDTALAKARESAEAMIASAHEAIAEDRHRSVAASRADLVALAKAVASRILADRGKDADLHADIAAALARLASLPGPERQRLHTSLENPAATISVETAEIVGAPEQDAIAEQLRRALGTGAEIVFATRPELLGGAKITLPHARLDASWASYLDAAMRQLLENDHVPRD